MLYFVLRPSFTRALNICVFLVALFVLGYALLGWPGSKSDTATALNSLSTGLTQQNSSTDTKKTNGEPISFQEFVVSLIPPTQILVIIAASVIALTALLIEILHYQRHRPGHILPPT